MLLQGKRPFHAPPAYETLSVNAHHAYTPLNIYIYFQLQIVLIPGKMDLKFTEINATEMYVVNLKSHIIAFHPFSLYSSSIMPRIPLIGYLLVDCSAIADA